VNEDLKEKMRQALEAKKGREQGGADAHTDEVVHEKVHGPEVSGSAAPQMHRRKAGGGGS
jgi:hypothetical protein